MSQHLVKVSLRLLKGNGTLLRKSVTAVNGLKYSNCAVPEKEHVPKSNLRNGPGLREFLVAGKNLPPPATTTAELVPYLNPARDYDGNQRQIYFEVYGCQMNVSDTEIVWSILRQWNYTKVEEAKDADVILIITCAIREGAETKIWNRLRHLTALKKNRSAKKGPLQIGILGCMAERLKSEVLEKEKLVDLVAGPDAYKDLPRLLSISQSGMGAVNVLLSLEETYADVMPVRLNENAVTSFVSIMRGCDNMCSYCIVPFTRGRERSRQIDTICAEARSLSEQGVKEITLLGQNVNSYRDLSSDPERNIQGSVAEGFRTVYKTKIGGARFADLLDRVATAVPNMRIRFTSPHPKDFPDDVLHAIKAHSNICDSIHLPAQSGSSAVLERMRRGYTREAYIDLVDRIRTILPSVTLSSDFICGFCGETDEEFDETVSLIERVQYNVAYLFEYSMREKTTAHRRYKDDVPDATKNERLRRMVVAFRNGATELQSAYVGSTQLILIEGVSKRSSTEFYGRTDGNIKVIVPVVKKLPFADGQDDRLLSVGDFIAARIVSANSQVLKGEPLYGTSIMEYTRSRI